MIRLYGASADTVDSLLYVRRIENRMRSDNQNTDRLWTKEFILLCLVAVVARIAFTCQYTAIPLYVQAKGGEKAVAGAAAGIYSIAALIVRPLMGNVVDKKGRRFNLLLGIGIFTAAMVIYSVVESRVSIGMILAMQCMTGIGFAALTVGMTTMCTDIVPASRLAQGIGIFGLSSTIANAIAPGLALALIDSDGGYRIYFVVVGLIAAVSLGETLFIRYEVNPRSKKKVEQSETEESETDCVSKSKTKRAWWESIAERNALFGSGLIILAMVAASSISAFLPTLANEYMIVGIGMFFTFQAIGTAVSRLGVGVMITKLGSYKTLNIGYACYIIAYLGIFSMKSAAIVCAMGIFSGVGQGILQTVLNTAAVVRAPKERRGAANATFYMAMDIGIGSGGFLWGAVADCLGTRMIFLGTIIMVLAAAVISFLNKEQVTGLLKNE